MDLFAKVSVLFVLQMLIGAGGCWLGRGIKSLGAILGLAVLFIFGVIGVFVAAHASPVIGVIALAFWALTSGLLLGPTIEMYAETIGWKSVAMCFLGTGGIMAVFGAIGALSGINFSGLGNILFFALFGLIIVSVVLAFVRMSREINIGVTIIGIVIFCGYFLFDFFRLAHSENTWERAIDLSVNIYLDFLNVFLRLLELYAQTHHK